MIKNLKEWLNRFDENKDFSIIIADPEKRVVYENKNVFFITDEPAIIIEIGKAEPLDGESPCSM